MIFVAAGTGAMWLWGRHVGLPNAVGEVHAVRADAVSLTAGRLVTVEAEGFGDVIKNQVVAELDPGPLTATMATYQKERDGLTKQLDADGENYTAQWEARHKTEVAEQNRLKQVIDDLRRDVFDRRSVIAEDKERLNALDTQLATIAPLVERGVEAPWRKVQIESERAVVQKRFEENQKTLAEAEGQLNVSEERLLEYELTQKADLAKLLAPTQAAIDTQDKRIKELDLQIEALKIRAPIAGTITAIHQWPGQNVQAGIPIMTIAAADSRYIVSYVRQETRIRPAVGMGVDVSVRSVPRLTAGATVEEVGPQVELIPQHQLRDPNVPEWGLPVRISVPEELGLRPGELVDVAFKTPLTLSFTDRGRNKATAAGEVQVADGAP
ncbi:MAG TPA: HlyD family efflux transporter periplasmic adaptor subunit [Phycisphaerae bacterium]|nr:HlyD family efflux transporter periplasmic adaptor subunit [Phycisphaerae bacterium]